MNSQKIEIMRVQLKTTYIGLILNVFVPITLIIVIYLLAARGIVASGGFDFFDKKYLQVLFFLLLAVSLGDFAAIYIYRKRYVAGLVKSEAEPAVVQFENSAVRLAWITYLMNLMHVGYGVGLLILGSPYEVILLFMALTLVGYQIFRPRRKYLERLYRKFDESDA